MLGTAHRALARFDALLPNMDAPELLLAPLMTQEAVMSSRIEGTQATLDDVLHLQIDPAPAKREEADDAREVDNYRIALEHACGRLEEIPLSVRLLKEAHTELLSGVRGGRKDPGNFRNGPVHIGPPGCSSAQATYVPPEAQRIPELFAELERYMHADAPDALVQLALVHAQFELIHPFWDGNGRIGRLLIPLFLYDKRIISQPCFYLSEHLERHRDAYYDGLADISSAGAWMRWVEFFLDAVAQQADANSRKAQRIIALRDETTERARRATRSQFAPQVARFLCARPIFSSVQFRKESGVPRTSAARVLNALEADGVVTNISRGRGRRPAVWRFPEMLRVVES